MLELSLLGDPSATLDGRTLSESLLNKDLGLLYFLAVRGQAQSRTALAVLLWGDLSETAARGNLRKSLYELRQCLGDHLVIEREHVTLVAADASVDVWEFERLASNGLATADPVQLQAAAAIYRGDFLDGLAVRNAPDYERWRYNMQEHLRTLAVRVLTALAAHFATAGDFPQAIAAQRRMLELEPWREEAHRELMQLLASDGQRSAAVAQYKLCVQVLAAELGIEPSAETTALAQQISTAAAPQAITPPLFKPVAALTYSNLPSELAPIVGRMQELHELSQMLRSPDCRLLTILGIGGIGKSRLALALAHQLRPEYAHVTMISLRATSRAGDILSTIGRALGIAGGATDDAILELLRRDNPRWLLVLDSFEHLLPEGVGVINQLLDVLPHLQCVVTAREALSTRWEWRFHLAELSFPTDLAAENPAGYSSVQLFLQCARRIRSRPIEGAELRQVTRICHLVGGMPLGVELAAAQAGSLPCTAIADQIEAGIERLAADLRDLPMRQRSLAASFEVSWTALSPQEQNVLARLSVIPGGCALEAALIVAEATVADIIRLVDKSLVRLSSTHWYSLHEVIKQHAAAKLALIPGAPTATFARYSDYLTTWVERNLRRYMTPLVWEQEAGHQLENYVQQLWHAWLISKDPAQKSQIAVALTHAEGAFRCYTSTLAGKHSSWTGLELFTEDYLQTAHADSGVVVIDNIWLPVVADQLVDLTAEFAAQAASLLPGIVDIGCVAGRLLSLPNDIDLGLLYYRADLLRKYGYTAPPATWEELEHMATTIQASERAAGNRNFWGFIWPGRKPESLTCTALEWQHAEGGGCIIERDGRISIASPQVATALTRAARWVGTISPPDFTEMEEWEMQRVWVNGGAAFMRGWAAAAIEHNPDITHAATQVTVLPRGAVRRAATYGGWPLAVRTAAKQRSEAFELVRNISTPEVQRMLARQSDLRLPAAAAIYQDPAILQARPLLQDVYTLITDGGLVVRPFQVAGKLYAQVSALYAETVAAILDGRVQALPALQELAQALADLGGWSR